MTTIAPIDIEKPEEAAVLIDYENIRLSWEKAYCRLFTYTDLCWLCELTEQRFKTAIRRIVVFMSDPNECVETCCAEQLDEMKKTLKYLQEDQARSSPLLQQQVQHRADVSRYQVQQTKLQRTVNSIDLDSSLRKRRQARGDLMLASAVNSRTQLDFISRKKKKRKIAGDNDEIVDLLSDSENEGEESGSSSSSLSDDTKSRTSRRSEANRWSNDYENNVHLADNDKTECISDSDLSCVSSILTEGDDEAEVEITSVVLKETKQSGTNDHAPFIRLGEGACPKAEIIVKAFSYKRQRHMRVQRGCDVEIGVEVTKICFMPFFSSILLFSADSDFETTTRQCAQAEVYGGIIKYAKPIRILGFSRSFEKPRFLKAREEHRYRKSLWLRMKGCKLHHKDITDFENQSGVYLIDYEFPSIKRILEKTNRPLLPPSAFQLRSTHYRQLEQQPPPPPPPVIGNELASSVVLDPPPASAPLPTDIPIGSTPSREPLSPTTQQQQPLVSNSSSDLHSIFPLVEPPSFLKCQPLSSTCQPSTLVLSSSLAPSSNIPPCMSPLEVQLQSPQDHTESLSDPVPIVGVPFIANPKIPHLQPNNRYTTRRKSLQQNSSSFYLVKERPLSHTSTLTISSRHPQSPPSQPRFEGEHHVTCIGAFHGSDVYQPDHSLLSTQMMPSLLRTRPWIQSTDIVSTGCPTQAPWTTAVTQTSTPMRRHGLGVNGAAASFHHSQRHGRNKKRRRRKSSGPSLGASIIENHLSEISSDDGDEPVCKRPSIGFLQPQQSAKIL